MEKGGYVYVLASRWRGVIYIGVTSNLPRRIWEHKQDLVEGFSRKYGTKNLVYFELFDDIATAIQREKSLKRWSRAWKIRLIEEFNPEWRDLFREFTA